MTLYLILWGVLDWLTGIWRALSGGRVGIPNVEGHGEREESKGAEVTPELESLGRGKESYSEAKQNLKSY